MAGSLFSDLIVQMSFLVEEILDLIGRDYSFGEHVSTCSWRLVHADALYDVLCHAFVQCCDCFLCHSIKTLRVNYLVSR